MTDDEARAASDPSPEAAAVRAAQHARGADEVAGSLPLSHGAVPRESAVAVGQVGPADSAEALDRLRRAGIPAFLHGDASRAVTVYVDAPDVDDARTVLATLGAAVQPPDPAASPDAELSALDEPPGADDELTDEAVAERFSALIGQWEQAASPEAGPEPPDEAQETARFEERADAVSARLGDPEDPPELQEEHFERPLPPPMPRPSRAGAVAIAVVLLGVAILAFGGVLGLNADESLTVGVIVTLTGALLLGRRLKQYRDDSDDGAVL